MKQASVMHYMIMIKKSLKDNPPAKRQVKFTQANKSKNKDTSNNISSSTSNYQQPSKQKGKSAKSNKGGMVKQVTDTNHLPPGYLSTIEEDDEQQGFQYCLFRVLIGAILKTTMQLV